MISLYLAGRVQPGRRDDLLAFLAVARATYEAPGGITVRLQWDLHDPDAFVEIMEYADLATYEADQLRVASDPAMLALLDEWHELLAWGPEVTVFTEATIGDRATA